ncbi:MAG: hypothetical protein Q7J60_20965, partial [Bradyrhizobium sp.]|nr:hypothetical protein [Bradyrhizobium sp.]
VDAEEQHEAQYHHRKSHDVSSVAGRIKRPSGNTFAAGAAMRENARRSFRGAQSANLKCAIAHRGISRLFCESSSQIEIPGLVLRTIPE